MFKAPDGTLIECDVDENYIPVIRSKGTAKGRGGRPPRALPVASVQTDPVMYESTLSPAYSPRSMSVDRTPVVTPDRPWHGDGDEAEFGEYTLSPIPFEGEVGGMDPSAIEALASVHRISPPDGDGAVSYTHLTLPTNREV